MTKWLLWKNTCLKRSKGKMDNPVNRCIGYFLLSVAFFFAYKIFHKLDKRKCRIKQQTNHFQYFSGIFRFFVFIFVYSYRVIIQLERVDLWIAR